jgi:hypothetical protein
LTKTIIEINVSGLQLSVLGGIGKQRAYPLNILNLSCFAPAGVAQQVEQLICNQQVAGSSPIASSREGLFYMEGFPSGQREQTVNLPAEPTEVQILPPPSFIDNRVSDLGIGRWALRFVDRDFCISGSSSVARASAFQAEGRGFESRFPLHK